MPPARDGIAMRPLCGGIPKTTVANGMGPEAAADIRDDSPETYIGYAQASGFDSPESVRANSPKLHSSATTLSFKLNQENHP
jgi:hypothetical protein